MAAPVSRGSARPSYEQGHGNTGGGESMDSRIESIREIARSAVPMLLLLAYVLSVARCDGGL